MTTKNNAIYVGTFDPLTNGHLDIIVRASKIFRELVVAIGHNPHKESFFTVEERMHMMTEVCKDVPNLKVTAFSGLAVVHAMQHGVTTMVRGLRTEADFTYEMQMAMMNKALCASLETVFIPTKQELSHISSSLVKDVALMGGDVSPLVPPIVFKQLIQKNSNLRR